MRRLHSAVKFLGLLGVGLVFLLSGCGGSSSTTYVPPQQVVVNGYTVDPNSGVAQLSLSALDDKNNLITSGVVQDAKVVDIQAEDINTGDPLPQVTGTARVCGQITAQQAVTCAMVLDATGSMASNDPNEMRKTAAKDFVARMTSSDLAGVASFSTDITPTDPYLAIHIWQDFTNDKAALESAIDDATQASGGTNLWDAVYDSVDWLMQQVSQNKVALILTDGEDNASTKTSQEAADYAVANGIKVYMIGLGDPTSLDFAEMQNVAALTGGLFAAAQDANELTKLFDGVFNASKASFCVEVEIRVNGAPPSPGTRVQGTINVTVNNKTLPVDFDVIF